MEVTKKNSGDMGRLGKQVGGFLYVHTDVIALLSSDLKEVIASGKNFLKEHSDIEFNVLKIAEDKSQISFLHYPDFFTYGFPTLLKSWNVNLIKSSSSFRDFSNSLNPPVLHRKETLLGEAHKDYGTFKALTSAAEDLGLFSEPKIIGFKQQWDALVNARGYAVKGNEFVPNANVDEGDSFNTIVGVGNIQRHLTALTRYGFSAPIQALARLGYLDGSKSLFDYGCGKGDDVQGLVDSEINAFGWDPYFRPDGDKRDADIVNLGFVINVIENPSERSETLKAAFSYARELLVVSAMIGSSGQNSSTFSDGVVTSRNTFQKYYRQDELKNYIDSTLGETSIAVSPGVFFVFKSEESAQAFTLKRLSNRRRRLAHSGANRARSYDRKSVVDRIFDEQWDTVRKLWDKWVELGREPEKWELPIQASEISARSLRPIFQELPNKIENGEAILKEAVDARHDDLRVFFARAQFAGNKRFRLLEPSLKQDIKVFYGNYESAIESGRELLFSLADVNNLILAARKASEQGLGFIEDSGFFTHASLVEQLPSVLRAYVMCGTHLFGDLSSIDIIKIHLGSNKLSLMQYDDFEGTPMPKLVRRIKLNLRTTDIDVFEYTGEYPPQYLYRKSRYMNEEFSKYADQLAFEEILDEIGLLDFEGFGPSVEEFDAAISASRYEVDGYELKRKTEIPSLDESCGQNFTYRDFVDCGETQMRMRIDNVPRSSETYNALYELATKVLDPIIEYFGSIKLTYGFCSAALAKEIKIGIAPKLDQHASCELNQRKKPVCDRLGAACDFIIEDEDMFEVVEWINENIVFDRMYFYGNNRPIHISFSENPKREIYELRVTDKGNQVPKRLFL